LPDTLKSLYDNYKDRKTQPTFDEISKALHSATALYSRPLSPFEAMSLADNENYLNTSWILIKVEYQLSLQRLTTPQQSLPLIPNSRQKAWLNDREWLVEDRSQCIGLPLSREIVSI
jgi:hypothetical protein